MISGQITMGDSMGFKSQDGCSWLTLQTAQASI